MSDLQAGRARGKLVLERVGPASASFSVTFPVEAAHPHAMHAAQAAEAAGGQGKFWQMHDLLFATSAISRWPTCGSTRSGLELDMPRFIAEMDDEIYLQRVREHMERRHPQPRARHATFFINGVIQDVSFGMHSLIDGVEDGRSGEPIDEFLGARLPRSSTRSELGRHRGRLVVLFGLSTTIPRQLDAVVPRHDGRHDADRFLFPFAASRRRSDRHRVVLALRAHPSGPLHVSLAGSWRWIT